MPKETSSTSALSDELRLAQNARQELLKWKLVVISALGSAGLGFVENKTSFNLHLVLLLIPFSCAYVDLLCRNLSVRTKRIVYFMSTLEDDNTNEIDIKFAKFYQNLKTKTGLSLETYALIGSTITISAFVAFVGFFIKGKDNEQWLFLITGVIAIIISILIELKYLKEKRRLIPGAIPKP